MAKRKDRTLLLIEARELKRSLKKKTCNGIGDIMQGRYPEDDGLSEWIRKKLRKEDHPPSPAAATPSPPSAPAPTAARPRRHREHPREALMRQLVKESELKSKIAEEMIARTWILEQHMAVWEALQRDPLFSELLKRLREEE